MAGDNIGNAQPAQGKLYGLVRDKDGNVRFDDWFNIDKGFHGVLTEEDWQYIKEQQEIQHGNHSRTIHS